MSTATAGELRSGACLRLLALALAPPTDGSRAVIADLGRALADGGEEVDVALLVDAVEQAAAGEHAAAYQRLFGGAVAVAPYESSYERDPFRQARVMADVAGFYRAFGAEAHGPTAERPDHAGTELEFLGFLAALRVAALDADDGESAERIREIEDAFLTDHAGRWLPAFFRRLAASDPGGVFEAVGLVGEQAVTAELVARGLDPVAAGADPAPRSAVEEDELTCAAGDEPVVELRASRAPPTTP